MAIQTKKPAAKELIILRPDMHVPRWESVLEDAAQAPAILIVDDVDLNRRLLKAILKTANYRIFEAKRPSAAMAILEREKIDLVVIDLVIPEMSGPEFSRMLKNDRKTQLIPILMTTSVQGTENEVAGIESGADEFLLKPLQPSIVRSRVRAMLRNKALIDSLEEAETILLRWRNRWSIAINTRACIASGWRATASRSAARWVCRDRISLRSIAADICTISARSGFRIRFCSSAGC